MNIKWDSADYNNNFDFVYKYGEDVLGLVDAPKGSRVVDLGCGTGPLTQKLLEMGYQVTGLDASEDMLRQARELHPDITFHLADAVTFHLDKKANAIFSNAVFHWIDKEKQSQMLANIADNLVDGGILVFEFGGYKNAELVHGMLERGFEKRGFSYPRTFYFPSIGEYATLLEKNHLLVEYAALFDRPTPQKGENGLKDWINMFVKAPFNGMDEDLKNEIIDEAVLNLTDRLHHDDGWFVDYVRIRMRARKL